MRLFLSATLLATVALAGAVDAQSFKRIKTEAEFREKVVDRKLTLAEGEFIVRSNGKAKGTFSGNRFDAAWVWANQMYCRNALWNGESIGQDCQVVRISGDQVQFIREYGKGETGQMTIN